MVYYYCKSVKLIKFNVYNSIFNLKEAGDNAGLPYFSFDNMLSYIK